MSENLDVDAICVPQRCDKAFEEQRKHREQHYPMQSCLPRKSMFCGCFFQNVDVKCGSKVHTRKIEHVPAIFHSVSVPGYFRM